jgi:hypothetical protein
MTGHYYLVKMSMVSVGRLSVVHSFKTSDAAHSWVNQQPINYVLVEVDGKPPVFRSPAHESNWILEHRVGAR